MSDEEINLLERFLRGEFEDGESLIVTIDRVGELISRMTQDERRRFGIAIDAIDTRELFTLWSEGIALNTPSFLDFLQDAFPEDAAELISRRSRRSESTVDVHEIIRRLGDVQDDR